jgi:hypothetical protein
MPAAQPRGDAGTSETPAQATNLQHEILVTKFLA